MSSLGIDTWSATPNSNNATPPNGAPEGMAPSVINDIMRQMMAVEVSYSRSLPTAGGTANALTVTNAIPVTTLVTGYLQVLNPASANTGATTFAPDGLTAKNVFASGSALIGGEMQPNVPALLKYDGTQWNLLNPQVSPKGILSGALEATIFTANGNFTPKATANYLVIGVGGGGGGGGGGTGTASNGGEGGTGGGGGDIGFSVVSLTANTAYAVVIGGGGTAGAAAGDGGTGGNTTFNGVTIGAGGKAGRGGSASISSAAIGTNGSNGGGYGGGIGRPSSTTPASGGAGTANTGGGGGGGGSGNGAHTGASGGAGGSGILVAIRA